MTKKHQNTSLLELIEQKWLKTIDLLKDIYKYCLSSDFSVLLFLDLSSAQKVCEVISGLCRCRSRCVCEDAEWAAPRRDSSLFKIIDRPSALK